FVAETKATIPASRAGSHLFFRSMKQVYSPDLHAVLGTAAVGITEVRPNQGFSIRLGLLRPQSRGRIKITSADLDAPLLIDPDYLPAAPDLSGLGAAVEHMAWHKSNPVSQRLASVPGIGPIIATAIAATVVEPSGFRSGREFAAWLGLVPRQNSTGGKH